MVSAHTSNTDQAERFLKDVHSKNLIDLKANDYSFSDTPGARHTEEPNVSTAKKPARSRLSTALLTSMAMLTPLSLFGSEQDSAVADAQRGIDRDQSNAVRVYDFTQESWLAIKECLDERRSLDSIPGIIQHWNNIDAAMHVSDVTALDSIHAIREQIIEEGGHNAEIPEEVVHSALYTSAKYAEAIQDRIGVLKRERAKLNQLIEVCEEALEHREDFTPELITRLEQEQSRLKNQLEAKSSELEAEEKIRESISKAVRPYMGRFMVDVQRANRPAERFLVTESEFNQLKNQYPIVERYDSNNFDQLAAFIVAKAATEETLTSAISEIQNNSPGSSRYETALTVLEHLDTSVEVSLEQLKELASSLYERGTAASSHSILKAFGEELVATNAVDFSKLDEAQREHLARVVRVLAHNNSSEGLAAASQYLMSRDAADLLSNPTDADYMMLEALTLYSDKSPVATNVLHSIIAQHPKFVLEKTWMSGSLKQDGSAKWLASTALSEHFNSNRAEAEHVLRQLLDGSMTLRNSANQTVRIDLQGEHREAAKRTSLQIILSSPICDEFSDVFYEILNNSFSNEAEQAIALQGLARAGDKGAKKIMLEIGADSNVSNSLRSIALESALKLDVESDVDSTMLETVKEQYAFSMLELPQLLGGSDAEQIEELGTKSIFRAAIENRMETWLERQNAARAMAEAGAEVSDTEMFRMYQNSLRREFGAALAFQDELTEDRLEQFREMLEYLKDCKSQFKTVDTDLAFSMIHQMGRAGFTEARAVLVDIVRYPEHYASDPDRQGSFGVMYNASDTASLKSVVLQNLGGMVDLSNPDDEALKVLLTVARRDSSREYQADAQIGLEQLAERYESALNSMSPAQTGQLESTRAMIAEALLETLQYHADGHTDITQIRLFNITDQFVWAKLVDKFGGAEALLEKSVALMDGDSRNMETNGPDTKRFQRPDLARAAVHAMISNGKSVADLERMNLSEDELMRYKSLFEFIEKEQYWLSKLQEQKYTGDGQEFALVDVGYVKPNPLTPEMNQKVIYPSLLNPAELYTSRDYHPTAVAATFFAKNPDATIRTYSATSPMPYEEFRPEHTKDAFIRSLEDLSELQIAGEADVDVINYSLGFMNAALHDPEMRDQLLDLIRAHMQVLSKMGVVHSTAAANSYGEGVDSARYGAFGEVNSIGVAIDQDGTPIKQPGVFIAGAQDAYKGALQAEFQSVGEALRADRILNIIAFDGVHVLLPWYEDGQWKLVPVDGTSFGSPNQAAMLSWAKEAAKKAGVAIEHEEMQELFNSCTLDIKDRDETEGGKYFHVPTFLTKLSELLASKLD